MRTRSRPRSISNPFATTTRVRLVLSCTIPLFTALKNGDASKPGALAYLDNCAACHRPDGLGYERVFPRLAGNGVVQAGDPISLISIILNGASTPRTKGAPAQFAMPSFATRLSDQDVADVVNFIRSSWGNLASSTTARDVARVRKAIRPNG